MDKQVKKWLITIGGGFLVVIGTLFILLPGPAFLFIPIGLAILSLEYELAKKWLKKSQSVMKKSAVKTDEFFATCRRKIRK
ncbi:PGPGW domain-containing protein [Thalassotalea atypica]|uniref:PGPGW domain-containing protein n=1 Tax=Thalassotalea atypica TaxID=2054316 RepID=UPI00257262D6|nr:PGPGW domain-containing protein [Thalassotalea atypica]